MELETKRLVLRNPRISDWKDIVEGIGDIGVSKNLKFGPYPYKKKDAINWIKYLMGNWRKKNKESYTFFIELKSEGKVIGETGIYGVNKKDKKAITGSWINKKYWRKGYLFETKVPIFDFIFNKLKLRKIESTAWSENKASRKMLKKLGFKYEGTKRKSATDQATGKIHDIVLYGLFKEEWKKMRLKIIKEINKKIKQNEGF